MVLALLGSVPRQKIDGEGALHICGAVLTHQIILLGRVRPRVLLLWAPMDLDLVWCRLWVNGPDRNLLCHSYKWY
jgi:hypothetical protein